MVGVLGFLFGIYMHFSTRKVARIVYETNQIADYKLPPPFRDTLLKAPIFILIESVGTKAAENVMIRTILHSEITNYKVEPEDIGTASISSDKCEFKLNITKFNPSQAANVYLNCKGLAIDDQIKHIELSYSEGMGINKKSTSFTTVTFRLFWSEFEYNMLTREFYIRKFGPWVFK